MDSSKERLERAIEAFTSKQAATEFNSIAGGRIFELPEEQRQKELLRVLMEASSERLSNFLKEPSIQPQLDLLGLLRSTRQQVKGLAVTTFNVPRAERKFAHSLTLAYVPLYKEALSLFEAAAKDPNLARKGLEQNQIQLPELVHGFVFIREVGVSLGQTDSGKKQRSTLVEIIEPKSFKKEGIYETALNQDISANQLKKLIDKRFINFLQLLEEITKRGE